MKVEARDGHLALIVEGEESHTDWRGRVTPLLVGEQRDDYLGSLKVGSYIGLDTDTSDLYALDEPNGMPILGRVAPTPDCELIVVAPREVLIPEPYYEPGLGAPDWRDGNRVWTTLTITVTARCLVLGQWHGVTPTGLSHHRFGHVSFFCPEPLFNDVWGNVALLNAGEHLTWIYTAYNLIKGYEADPSIVEKSAALGAT